MGGCCCLSQDLWQSKDEGEGSKQDDGDCRSWDVKDERRIIKRVCRGVAILRMGTAESRSSLPTKPRAPGALPRRMSRTSRFLSWRDLVTSVLASASKNRERISGMVLRSLGGNRMGAGGGGGANDRVLLKGQCRWEERAKDAASSDCGTRSGEGEVRFFFACRHCCFFGGL